MVLKLYLLKTSNPVILGENLMLIRHQICPHRPLIPLRGKASFVETGQRLQFWQQLATTRF